MSLVTNVNVSVDRLFVCIISLCTHSPSNCSMSTSLHDDLQQGFRELLEFETQHGSQMLRAGLTADDTLTCTLFKGLESRHVRVIASMHLCNVRHSCQALPDLT